MVFMLATELSCFMDPCLGFCVLFGLRVYLFYFLFLYIVGMGDFNPLDIAFVENTKKCHLTLMLFVFKSIFSFVIFALI